MTRLMLPRRRLASQRGVFGILFAIMLPVMLAMIGLAIDLSMIYARGKELQGIADSTALAAARALDGTTAGITAAKDRASDTARMSSYRFLNPEEVSWTNDALSFAATPNGPWIGADSAGALDAPTLFFARVDTAGLDARHGKVALAFLQVVGGAGEHNMVRRAVAGRRDSAIAPLAVCALNNTEIIRRVNAVAGFDEALEHGFRRGVTYNLLNLNPNGTTPVNYAINPVDFAPAPALPSHQTEEALRPFACSGMMPAPPLVAGSMLYVSAPFPASMVADLNSRFGDFGGATACDKFGAPPDANVIEFRDYTGFWMRDAPVGASADPLVTSGKLVTVADAVGATAGTNSASYGTLWSFGKPMRFDTATGGMGAAFTRNDWDELYPVSSGPAPSSIYTAAVLPYKRGVAPHVLRPVGMTTLSGRRVLNVPLLECPVAGASARMLGIGRFLMTTRATSSPLGIHAEFGGLTTYGALAASAVLYQ